MVIADELFYCRFAKRYASVAEWTIYTFQRRLLSKITSMRENCIYRVLIV